MENSRRNLKYSETESMIFNIFLLLIIIPLILILIYQCICKCFASIKSKRVGPITRTPIIPFYQEGLHVFEGNDNLKNVIPEAKIQCTESGITGSSHDSAIQKMNELMLWIFDLDRVLPDEFEEIAGKRGEYKKKPKDSVPTNAKTISIKMENFKHGLKCHDFVPIDGISPGSYYTYQMFGDNRIQVTRYVKNGVSYVAGFCIYIPNSKDLGEHYRRKVMYYCTISQKYQRRAVSRFCRTTNNRVKSVKNEEGEVGFQDSEAVLLFDNGSSPINKNHHEVPLEELTSPSSSNQINHQDEVNELTIKYCPKLQRTVMSCSKFGTVIHREWDKNKKLMMNEECQTCSELLNDEEPPAYSSLSLV